MSKKKSYSQEDLKNLKITDDGIKEKTPEEIEMEAKTNTSIQRKNNNLNVNHSIKIPDGILEDKKKVNSIVNLKATAPYNFIPLNDKVIDSKFKIDENKFDKYDYEKRQTGYIELKIKTKEPIYIRSSLKLDELKKFDKIEKDLLKLKKGSEEYKNKYKEKLQLIKKFFAPGGGELRIPGSSIRGLTRTIVEIISWSKFTFTEKYKKFHFRSFADRSLDLREKFSSKMLKEEKDENGRSLGFTQNVKAGYLIKDGNSYKIKPADTKINNCWFFRVEEDEVIKKSIISEKMNKKSVKEIFTNDGKKIVINYEKNKKYSCGFKKIKFTYEEPDKHVHSKPLYYAKAKEIFNFNNSSAPNEAIEGVLVYTGWMPGKPGRPGKHMHWAIGPSEQKSSIDFLPGVIENYKNDVNRDENANLLEWFKKFNSDCIPCFFLTENINENSKSIEKVSSFGHTGIFRLAYDKSIKDFLPTCHMEENIIDITESIFGNETKFVGRVFFEDAIFNRSEKSEISLDSKHPKILSTPKPTTFQHYLVQKEITPLYDRYDKLRGFTGLKDYNSDGVSLRGNKMYWHKNSDLWLEQRVADDKITQYTLITPVDSEATFTGRIRFENLSDIELGTLLFALELPPECCHKIGMGKPLGLGSIKITPTLHLSERKDRYTKISDEWTSELKESTSENKNINHFKDAFEKYMLEKLNSAEKSLWEIDRMQELKRMLDFTNKPAPQKTRYMKIEPKPNEFRNRPVLPKPTDVK